MSRNKRIVAVAIATPILVIALGVVLAIRSAKNSVVVERVLDPRLLFSEVDDTLGIPLTTELQSKKRFGVFSSKFDYRILTEVISPATGGLQPAGVYFGGVQGRTGGYAFVYPPKQPAYEWAVQVQGAYVEGLKFGSFNLILRSTAYIWRTPVFQRVDDQTHEFKRPGKEIIPGTKLFYNHARTDYAHIGTLVTGPTVQSSPNGILTNAVEVEFVHGVREWIPAAALTNYFVYRH